MFCSHCGKSIRPEDISCPHCGAVLGEDRFVGNMYTSSQVRLPVDGLDQAPAGSLAGYTRTDYMSYDNQPEDDVYSNTTYRPLLNDEEDMSRQDEEEAAYDAEPFGDEAPDEPLDQAAEDDGTAPEQDEPEAPGEDDAPEVGGEPDIGGTDSEPEEDAPQDIPLSADDEESVSPLPELKPAGISPAVQRYMREMEERQRGGQKSGFKIRLPFRPKQEEPEYEEEPAEDIPGVEPDQAASPQPDPSEPGQDAQAEETAAQPADYEETAYEEDGYEETGYEEADVSDQADGWQSEPQDDQEYDDYDYDEEEEKKPGFKLDLSALKNNRAVQIAIAAVLVIAVLIGGIRWLSYVTASFGTKIAGVTHDTYSQGIKLITGYVDDTYCSDLIEQGAVNADYVKNKLGENMAALNALMPAEPQENDEIFVTTLTIIQQAIETSIMADADAKYRGASAERAAASEQEWKVIKNAVATLSKATTVSQLSAIASDVEAAVIPTPSPSPSPTPATAAYATLKEGMMDNSAVEKMQNRLVELGYLTGGADGDFGAKTASAVKAFQQAAGLTADGIATPETQVALYADTAPRGSVTAETPAPEETPEPEA